MLWDCLFLSCPKTKKNGQDYLEKHAWVVNPILLYFPLPSHNRAHWRWCRLPPPPNRAASGLTSWLGDANGTSEGCRTGLLILLISFSFFSKSSNVNPCHVDLSSSQVVSHRWSTTAARSPNHSLVSPPIPTLLLMRKTHTCPPPISSAMASVSPRCLTSSPVPNPTQP